MIKYFFILVFPFFSIGQNSLSEIDSLLQNKNYSEAEQTLKTFLNEIPNNKKTLEFLGETYTLQKKWEEATLVFKQLVKLENTNAEYHYKYGEAMGMKALRSNAVSALFMINDVRDEFLKALEIDKNHIDTHWALIVYYTELPRIFGGSIKKAQKYSDQLKTISLVDYYLSQGYIYEYEKDSKKAEENYKMAVEVGGSFTCFEKLFRFYENEGKPQKAIRTIEEATEKLQRNSLNYQLGKLSAVYNLELGKGEKCLFKYIENYTPEDEMSLEWAYYRLAQIYRHKNDKQTALTWIDKSLSFQSNFEPAQKEKELILRM